MIRRLVVLVLLSLGLAVSAMPAHAETAAPQRLHRIVWTSAAHGIKLQSARHDGTHKRTIYQQEKGFTLTVVLDPSGRHAAFTTCCKDPADLIVASVLRGHSRDLLAHQTAGITSVSSLGWSPSGDRLAFTAYATRDGHQHLYLWTIRADGTHLTRLTRLPQPIGATGLEAVAWSRHGIVVCGHSRLREWRGGALHRFGPRNSWEPRLSGDGRHVYFQHRRSVARYFYERTRPDGSHLQILLTPLDTEKYTYDYNVVPSYDGSRLLALKNTHDGYSHVVAYDTLGGPGAHERTLRWMGDPLAYAWN